MRALAVMLLARTAAANSDDIIGRDITLDAGELEAQLTLATNLRPRRFGEPTSISPDAWFGVTDALTVGVVHSARSLDEIDADRPLCTSDCQADYRGGLDARYEVHRYVAPRVRLLVRDTDPWKPAVTVGALVHYTKGRFALTTDPYLRLGLANRDLGNRATLLLPLQLAMQPTCKWMIALRVGYDGALAVARDGWRGQLGAVAGVHPIEPLELTIELGFRTAFGPVQDGRERTLMVTAGWRARVL